jgi:hypothetical protein
MRRPSLIAILSGVAVAMALGVAGCITPSIPIPPPDPELMTFALAGDGADSNATFAYPANVNYVGSIVFVYNNDRGDPARRQRRSDPPGQRGARQPDRRDLPARRSDDLDLHPATQRRAVVDRLLQPLVRD